MAAVLQHIDIDISYLSEPEQDQIRAVVKRDELLRQQLLEHIEQLQSDVEHLREQQETVNESHCARCHQQLSLSDAEDSCDRCHNKVCVNSSCRLPANSVLTSTPGNYSWICILCYKEIELQLVSGAWLYQGLRRHSDEKPAAAATTEAATAAASDLQVDDRDREVLMITEPGLGLTVRQLNHGDERWDIISSVSVKSNKTDTANMEEEVDTTNTDEPSTATPRVDDLVSDVEFKSPQTIGSVEVENTSVAAAIEEIEEINDDYQTDDVDDKLSAHSFALNTSVSSRPTSTLSSITSGSEDSIASAYSDWGLSTSEQQHVNVSGEVCFHIIHNSSMKRVEVVVQQCHNLAVVNSKKKYSNPYVKVYLLPEKSRSGKRKTQVIRKNVNPVYEETLIFETDDASSLEKRTVWLAVWHSDRFRSNVFLGDVIVPLHNYEFEGRPTWYPLQQQGREKWKSEMILTHTSELELSLEYIEQTTTRRRKRKSKTGELHVVIKQAFNLMPVKATGIVNAFCRIRIISVNRRRKDHHKTAVVNNSQDPEWNQQFVFTGVTLDQLQHCCGLEITVWDYERFTTSNFLGALHLNIGTAPKWPVNDWTNAEGNEMDTWQQFVNEQPETVLDARLQLRNL